MRSGAALGLAAVTLGGCFVASVGLAGDRAQPRASAQTPDAAAPPPTAPPPPATLPRVPELPAPRARAPRTVAIDHTGATITRRTILRRAPGGPHVGTIGRRTQFGSRQSLAVVARRGGWLAVLHPWMPNGRPGWIPAGAATLVERPWEIAVDRSRRRATVRLHGDVVRRLRVGIGRPGTPTPLGRFAVTDRLRFDGPPYGPFVLALSGRQPHLPRSWPGGDRIAFHGRPGADVRTARTTGCLVAGDRDLRWLVHRVPVGTQVTIRR